MWAGVSPVPVQTWQQEHTSASGAGCCKVAWAARRVATDGFMASRALARRSHVRLYIIAMCAYIWQRCAAIYSERMRLLVADACGVLGAYLLEHLDPHRAGARDDLGIVVTVSAAPRPNPSRPLAAFQTGRHAGVQSQRAQSRCRSGRSQLQRAQSWSTHMYGRSGKFFLAKSRASPMCDPSRITFAPNLRHFSTFVSGATNGMTHVTGMLSFFPCHASARA